MSANSVLLIAYVCLRYMYVILYAVLHDTCMFTLYLRYSIYYHIIKQALRYSMRYHIIKQAFARSGVGCIYIYIYMYMYTHT